MIRPVFAAVSGFALVACATSPQPSPEKLPMANHTQQVVELLKSIETGDSKPIAYINLDKTEANKALMQTYMDDLLQGRRDKFASYFDGNNYIQHSPLVADNLTGLFAGLRALAQQGLAVKYDRVHKVLGEGNFVLVVAE